MTDRLPTFFVIGAPKCGTTSLHFYLAQHPGIAMTTEKEPQIFAHPGYPGSLGRYDSLYSEHAAVRGESSAVYSQYPRWPGVAERIHRRVPDARLVYIVRDPVDRAIAHYMQHVSDRKERRPLADALADWERDDSLFLCPSRYATQLRQYLEHFDASRILVIDHHDLLERREPTLARVFAFLGVDESFRSVRFGERLNPRSDRRIVNPLGRVLVGRRILRPARRLPLPAAVRDPARRLLSKEVPPPELDPGLRGRIAESLRGEVTWLRQFTGEPFSTWSI